MAARNGAERSANSKLWQLARKKQEGFGIQRGTEREEYIRHSQSDRNAENAVPVRIDDWDEEAEVSTANAKKRTSNRLPAKAGTMRKIPLPGIRQKKRIP